MRLLPYLPGKDMIKKLTAKAANAITLEDYGAPADDRKPAVQ